MQRNVPQAEFRFQKALRNKQRTAQHVPHRNVPQVIFRYQKTLHENSATQVRRSRCGLPQANRTCFYCCIAVRFHAVRCVADFWKLVLRCVALQYSILRYVTLCCRFLETGFALRCGSVQYVAVRCIALPSCGNPALMWHTNYVGRVAYSVTAKLTVPLRYRVKSRVCLCETRYVCNNSLPLK